MAPGSSSGTETSPGLKHKLFSFMILNLQAENDVNLRFTSPICITHGQLCASPFLLACQYKGDKHYVHTVGCFFFK